jgi:cysteinyl-tRNA synthetase
MRPDEMPRATEWIDEMQSLISQLIDRGHAYVIEGEGVYFQVDSLPEYGGLSHRTIEELVESAGARVEVDERKRSPVDFALWKAAKPGEPCWESPWGAGRPGWHIECSAMSLKILGPGFDLHGGGSDLVFPHHENEIAQAVGAGHEFARHWIHNGMLNVNGEKMSKSLGNFTTLADVLDGYDPRAFRMLVLKTHYRRQMEVGPKELGDAQKDVESFDTLLRRAAKSDLPEIAADDSREFRAAMDDDFDTPAAVAVIQGLRRDANKALDQGRPEDAARLVATVRSLAGVLGIGLSDATAEVEDDVVALVERRDAARAAKEFAESDRIRDELLERGIMLEDTPNGTVWRRA